MSLPRRPFLLKHPAATAFAAMLAGADRAAAAPMFDVRGGNESTIELATDGTKETFIRLENETRPLELKVEGPITLAVKFRVLTFGKAFGRLDVARDGRQVSENRYELDRNFSADLAETGTSAEKIVHVEAPAGEHVLQVKPAYGLPVLVRVLRIPKSQKELLASPEITVEEQNARLAGGALAGTPAPEEATVAPEISRIQPAAEAFASDAELPPAPPAPAIVEDVPAPATPVLAESKAPPATPPGERNGRLALEAFVDANGDGARQPGERVVGGLEVRVIGPEYSRTIKLAADGTGLAEWWSEGPYLVTVAGGVPGDLAAGPRTSSVLDLRTYGQQAVALAFEPPKAAPSAKEAPSEHGRLDLVAFVDRNGDGVRQPDESAPAGLAVRVVGPEYARTITLDSAGRGRAEWWSRGPYLVSIGGTLPEGIIAGTRASTVVDLQAYGAVEVPLALEAPRVVGGRVCIDRDRSGACEGDEPGLANVRVRLDDAIAVSGLDGTFSLGQQRAGELVLGLFEADLRGGLGVPDPAPTVASGATDVSIALAADPYTRRESAVVVDWPGGGRVRAREIGGFVVPGELLRYARVEKGKRGKKDRVETELPEGDRNALRALVKGRAKDTKLFVSVARSPALGADEAEAEAATIAGNLVKWLRSEFDVELGEFATETTAPASTEALVNVRVLQQVK